MDKQLKIYTDGGSRGNPGPSAAGYVLIDAQSDEKIAEKGIYLGVTTNNQAEYLALKYALEEAIKLGYRNCQIYMDSLLVVNQMRGIFKVKNRDLWPVHESIGLLTKQFKHVSFTHIPREQNVAADTLVNNSLDRQQLNVDSEQAPQGLA